MRLRVPASPSPAVVDLRRAREAAQAAPRGRRPGRAAWARRAVVAACAVARIPRRYRGRDIFDRLAEIGWWDMVAADLPDPRMTSAARAGPAQQTTTRMMQHACLHRLQLYYCQPGRMWDEFKTRLIARARAGVRILFRVLATAVLNVHDLVLGPQVP